LAELDPSRSRIIPAPVLTPTAARRAKRPKRPSGTFFSVLTPLSSLGPMMAQGNGLFYGDSVVIRRVALVLGLLVSCTGSPPPPPSAKPAPVPAPVVPSAAPAASAAPAPLAPEKIAYIEDNYGRALAEARAKKRPIFVDTWAAWCHSCVSMREYVLHDPALEKLASSYVWLSIDTERSENAEFLTKFPIKELPTLWVIDAETETASLKWLGAATATELADLLGEAASGGSGEAAAALLKGNQASAANKTDDAIRAYRAALAAAPKDWPRRGHVVEALAARLSETKREPECVELVKAEIAGLAVGTSLSNALVSGITCSFKLEKGTSGRAELRRFLDRALQLAREGKGLLADDRSSLFEHAVAGLRAEAERDLALRVAREWATFLEEEAKRATTPAARAVFDSHRLGAYLELGEPQRAIPMLTESEKDLPQDYNPPARLARAHFALRQIPQALAAVERALAKAYGPRKLRIYELKADILLSKGDRAGGRAALGDAIAYARTIPLTGGYPRLLTEIEKRKRALD
jgi:tetratricopeptide (TPR) repeat protein